MNWGASHQASREMLQGVLQNGRLLLTGGGRGWGVGETKLAKEEIGDCFNFSLGGARGLM